MSGVDLAAEAAHLAHRLAIRRVQHSDAIAHTLAVANQMRLDGADLALPGCVSRGVASGIAWGSYDGDVLQVLEGCQAALDRAIRAAPVVIGPRQTAVAAALQPINLLPLGGTALVVRHRIEDVRAQQRLGHLHAGVQRPAVRCDSKGHDQSQAPRNGRFGEVGRQRIAMLGMKAEALQHLRQGKALARPFRAGDRPLDGHVHRQ
jgi:hypothetical protein